MLDYLLNVTFGWVWILVGLVGGAVMGVGFRDERWLGGYASRPRRMVRLAHIAAVQLGVLNILYGFTTMDFAMPPALGLTWIAGAVMMPIACLLYAWREQAWTAFVPAVAVVLAAAGLTVWRMMPWSWS